MDPGPWLCVDSFLACLAIGVLFPPRGDLWLSVALGAWDAAATAAGTLVPDPGLRLGWLLCVALAGVLAPRGRRVLHLAPALLSLDDLFGGLPAAAAPALGVASAGAAFAGLALGRRLVVHSAA